MEARVKKVYNEIEAIRNEKRENKIVLCPERDPETKSYCTCEFLSKAGLDRHILQNLHKFPVGVNARDRAILQNNRPGGCLAIGSRPDRSEKNTTFQDIIPSRAGESGEIDAHCLGKFNRKRDGVIYKKPKVLVDFLMDLFKVTPKLRAKEMRDIMAKAIDPEDGGLLFCPSKADTKGILLSEDTIQQFISTQAKNKKS